MKQIVFVLFVFVLACAGGGSDIPNLISSEDSSLHFADNQYKKDSSMTFTSVNPFYYFKNINEVTMDTINKFKMFYLIDSTSNVFVINKENFKLDTFWLSVNINYEKISSNIKSSYFKNIIFKGFSADSLSVNIEFYDSLNYYLIK